MTAKPLPVVAASDLADGAFETSWLVEDLWSEGAVGLCGGEPKAGKTFLALDLAVAVASGKPCLGRFAVPNAGRVVLFAAEDAPHVIKRRLAGIATARGVALDGLDIQVITAERLRLDVDSDVAALDATVAALRPRLLVLDPFVRLHRIDENSSAEVAALLDRLRIMQRRHGVAILIVHHAKKGGSNTRAGQALRGSSEFHAWVDSLLYLRRSGNGAIRLTAEHRAAPSSLGGIGLTLVSDGDRLALEVDDEANASEDDADDATPATTPAERVVAALSRTQPMPTKAVRDASSIRMSTLCEVLADLVRTGRVRRTASGYLRADQ